jgi:hypothetical protein
MMTQILKLRGKETVSQTNSAALKVLYSFLVRLCCISSRECPKVPTLPSLGVLLSGIEAILAALEFPNHDRRISVKAVADN